MWKNVQAMMQWKQLVVIEYGRLYMRVVVIYCCLGKGDDKVLKFHVNITFLSLK